MQLGKTLCKIVIEGRSERSERRPFLRWKWVYRLLVKWLEINENRFFFGRIFCSSYRLFQSMKSVFLATFSSTTIDSFNWWNLFFGRIFCCSYRCSKSMKSVFSAKFFASHTDSWNQCNLGFFVAKFSAIFNFASSLRPSIPRRVVSGDLHWYYLPLQGLR